MLSGKLFSLDKIRDKKSFCEILSTGERGKEEIFITSEMENYFNTEMNLKRISKRYFEGTGEWSYLIDWFEWIKENDNYIVDKRKPKLDESLFVI